MEKIAVNRPVIQKNNPGPLLGSWYPSARPQQIYRAQLQKGCVAYGLPLKFAKGGDPCCTYLGSVSSFSGRPLIRPGTTVIHPNHPDSPTGYYPDHLQYLRSRGETYAAKQVGAPLPGTPYLVDCDTVVAGVDYKGTVRTEEGCCTKTVYKPSNTKFGTQGGVSSSARLDRLKVDLKHVASLYTKPGIKRCVPYGAYL
jgi:hypothetical protein